MSFSAPVSQVQQFTTNVMLRLQQSSSRLQSNVTVRPFLGKAATVVEQFGQTAAVRLNARHSDTPIVSTPQDRRWVFPQDYVWNELTDEQDLLRMLIDPTSSYAQGGAAAMGRAIDDEIISGLFGSNKTGENGSTDTGGRMEGGLFVTDHGPPLNLRYVAQITDASEWDPAFSEVLAWRLAMEVQPELAPVFAESRLQTGLKKALRAARRSGAIEANGATLADSFWLLSRL
jgi:Phage capsid protein